MTPDTFLSILMWVAVVASVGSLCILYFVVRDAYTAKQRRLASEERIRDLTKLVADLALIEADLDSEFPDSFEEEAV